VTYIRKIFGPPGTGKTTTLLNILEEALASGIDPDDIGYIAFTVKAAKEAKERASERFPKVAHKLHWFRTLHSLCYSLLKLDKARVLQRKHYSQICKDLQIEYSGYVSMDEGAVSEVMVGDRLIFIEGLAKARMTSFEEEFHRSSENRVSWLEANLFERTLNQYKEDRYLVDFNDMLSEAVDEVEFPSFKILFIDEAQDLSLLQWRVIKKLVANAGSVYIAGDDDQAIFTWAGADVDSFLDFEGEIQVLDHSYRIGSNTQALAQSIIGSVSRRQDKIWSANASQDIIEYSTLLRYLELDKGQWLILARNSFLLKEAQDLCFQEGYSYEGKGSLLTSESLQAIRAYEKVRAGENVSEADRKLIEGYGGRCQTGGPIWHEALRKIPEKEREYFLAARSRGESLVRPRIKISTIHGAKGGEAENVAIYSDMSARTYDSLIQDPDPEHRVFYVGVTRAKKKLHIIEPQGKFFFAM